MGLRSRFKKEAASFDSIARDRARNRQIPDLQAEFLNPYFYNNIWRNSCFLKEEYGPIRDWFVDSLKKAGASRVIELGCGNGWLSLELAREGFVTTGLDISPESIRVAKSYLKRLDKEKLVLDYVCENIVDYQGYRGESIVCFGFLHHLPPPVLRRVLSYLAANMKKGSLLLAAEPRYDHASKSMAAMIYALRLALPNHFKYSPGSLDNPAKNVNAIFAELKESVVIQSEMDKESSSDLIIRTIRKSFDKAELKFSTAFYDKIIGSIRVDQEDSTVLSSVLKRLDNMIIKYRPGFSRTVMIKAWNI
jgi:2-polyprenyl-3-methyl-5-hydroxy-6-metoxy-1,4-benzoquinol methylase